MKVREKILSVLLSAAMVVTMLPAGTVRAEETDNSKEGLIAEYVFEDGDATDLEVKDISGNNHTAAIKGNGATVANGILTLPGGAASSTAAYVELPGDMFEKQDTLTISIWLKNSTGANNYAAMSFGTTTKHAGGGTANYPINYWLLNPANPSGYFKSVWTDGDSASGPWGTETATSTTKTSADWGMYTTVITPDRIIGYYNGVEVCNNAKTKTTTDFGTGLTAYIGRSGYNDMYYSGGVYGVKVYSKAMTEQEIWQEYYSDMPYGVDAEKIQSAAVAADAAALDLGDIEHVTEDLTLPVSGAKGTTISWSSSNPEAVSDTGAVVRDQTKDVEVVLTATITAGDSTTTKEFTVKVICGSQENMFKELVDKLELGYSVLDSDISLPVVNGEGITTKWSSNSPAVTISETDTESKAVVHRPAEGEEDAKAVLTATVTCNSNGAVLTETKTFYVTVRAENYAYLLAYTNNNESAALGSSLHLAYSLDGEEYTALNSNTGICFANNAGGSKNVNPNGLKNLYLFRKTDGTYGLLATNVSTQKYIYVFDSENLVDFTNERKLTVSSSVSGKFKVEYEEEEKAYKVYWTDGSKQYSILTKDFKTAENEKEEAYTAETVSAKTLPAGAAAGNILGVSKKEYQYVAAKLDIVKNTGIKPIEGITAKAGDDLTKLLPKKVTAEYNDGSTTEMSVAWSTEDLAKVDLNKAGTYTVTGTVQQTQYANPFIEQRADPCILKGNDGYYYFTASYPMCGGSDKDGYDKIVLRRSETINGLADAEEITIWDCDESSSEYRYIWAPEIRLVNDEYYVFYTSSVSSSSVWSIRPHVLKCTDPENIMEKESWEAMGTMQAVKGDGQAFSGFSLDMTVFENNDRWYVAWAQTDGFSSIFVAEIDPEEPWKCISECVKISVPEYSWERVVENVNEGPSIIKNNGKIYMAFSASGTGPEYCIGLLSIDEDADILDASAWKKQGYPVLTSADVPGEYGPGHNSFTVDEEGNAIFVYHARGQECYDDKCAWAGESSLYDPCRDARLKRVHWAADGSPILKMSYEEELAEEYRTVTATIMVPAKEEPIITPQPQPAPGNDTVAETVVKVTKSSLTLGVKETFTLKASVTGAAGRKVTWSTSKKSVATVSSSGKITAKKKGTATITAKTADGKTATCKVTVKAAPTKITLNAKSKSLKKGKTFQIKVKLPKNTASNKITYASNKKSVATVSSTGKVTAKKAGKATITVKTFNGKKATLKVTVK